MALPTISLTCLNDDIIRVECLKLQSFPKYNLIIEGNTCKKWIKKIYTYVFYYKNCNDLINKKEKIGKDITKRRQREFGQHIRNMPKHLL